MKRHCFSIRYQLLLLYMVVVIAVCLVYLPLSTSVRSQLIDHYQQQTQQLFERNVETFNHSVRLLYDVPSVMDGHSYYRECVAYKGDSMALLPKLCMTRPVLSDYLNSIPLVDRAFILFTNCGAVIDDQQVYSSLQEFVGYGVRAVDESAVADMLTSHSFHQFDRVSLSGSVSQGALLLFMHQPYNARVRVGAVYTQSTLQELFSLSGYPAGSSLRMADAQGVIFYQQGTAAVDCVLFEDRIDLPFISIELQIPHAYFDSMLASYDRMFQLTLLSALALGIALSIVLTRINYRPLKNLLGRLDEQFTVQQKNEYELINDYIQHRDTQISDLGVKLGHLQEHLRSSTFARLLTSSIPTASEAELGLSLLPELKEENYLAVIRMHIATDEQPLLFAPFAFLNVLGGYCQQTAYNQVALLFPAGADQLARLQSALESQQLQLNESGIAINAGVSESFRGIENMHIAYRQADLALSQHELISCFTSGAPLSSQPPAEFREAQRLYDMLLAGEDPEALLRSMAGKLAQRCASRSKYAQFASVVHFVYGNVAADLRLQDVHYTRLTDLQLLNVDEVVEQLCSDARNIVSCIQALRGRSGTRSRTNVIAHIQSTFAQPDCCAETIAQAVHLSTNSVYQIVREHAGRSLGEYIEELRVEKSCDLLLNSDMPVVEIAAACGWLVPATFYRAFKRVRGVTPSQYRKQHEKS